MPSDADYMKAVKGGDMATVQRMVDQAAKAAGFNVDIPLWHRTWTQFNSFKHSDDVKTWGPISRANYGSAFNQA